MVMTPWALPYVRTYECSVTQVDHFKNLEVNSSSMSKISRKYLNFQGLFVCFDGNQAVDL